MHWQNFFLFFTSLIVSGPKRILFIALTSVCIMSPTRLWCECVGQPVFVSGLSKNRASDFWHISTPRITIQLEKLYFQCRIWELFFRLLRTAGI